LVLPATFFLPHVTRYGSSRLVQNNVIHFESLVAGPRQWCDLLAVSHIAAVVLAAAVVFTAAVVLAAAVVFTAAVVFAAAVVSVLPLLLGLVPLRLCLVP
jgi:hypothetical protein